MKPTHTHTEREARFLFVWFQRARVCFVVWKFYFEKLPCGRAGVVNNRKERSRNKQETKTIAAIEKKKNNLGDSRWCSSSDTVRPHQALALLSVWPPVDRTLARVSSSSGGAGGAAATPRKPTLSAASTWYGGGGERATRLANHLRRDALYTNV